MARRGDRGSSKDAGHATRPAPTALVSRAAFPAGFCIARRTARMWRSYNCPVTANVKRGSLWRRMSHVLCPDDCKSLVQRASERCSPSRLPLPLKYTHAGAWRYAPSSCRRQRQPISATAAAATEAGGRRERLAVAEPRTAAATAARALCTRALLCGCRHARTHRPQHVNESLATAVS